MVNRLALLAIRLLVTVNLLYAATFLKFAGAPGSVALFEQAIQAQAVYRGGRVTLGATLKHLSLRHNARQRRLQIVCCRRQEVFLESGGFLTSAHLSSLIDERAILEGHCSLVGQQLDQLEVAVGKHRWLRRVDAEHAKSLAVCGDRRSRCCCVGRIERVGDLVFTAYRAVQMMKATRRRIALPKHFVRNRPRRGSFSRSFGVRTRPRVALGFG